MVTVNGINNTRGTHQTVDVNIREFMGKDIGSGDMMLVRVNSHGRLMDYPLDRNP